jgi:hypothetical protein
MDRELAMSVLNITSLNVCLPRMGALGHGDIVIRQQRSLGFLKRDYRDIVRRLVLGLGRDRGGIEPDTVQEAIDCDATFFVVGPLGVQPQSSGRSQTRRRLELLVVGIDFQEESGQ